MPQDYSAKSGDCISSIAFNHGFFWETLWDHGSNSELKSKRKDPNILKEGDVVHIPDLTLKQESGATEQRHRFKLKDVPAKLKIRVLLDGKPQANRPYKLEIDGVWSEGNTDGDGFVESSLPPAAKAGKLVVGKEPEQDVYELAFGYIDPLDTDEGVASRLMDLGYPVGDDLAAAIRGFQQDSDIEATGLADENTRTRLEKDFGL